jgi:hypothetical protein
MINEGMVWRSVCLDAKLKPNFFKIRNGNI